jgi:uncharacterized protein YjiS (DUF1127 family)
MSIYSDHHVINHHGSGLLAQLAETFHIWLKRRHDRYQLAQLSERERHDVGLTWSDVVSEAEKPFWRA